MPSTVFQVFGANTDVGKTVVSAGLLRAAAAGPPRRQATYIKPLQTGDVHDGTFVQRYAPKEVRCHTLYSWSTPISPHLAAAKEGKTLTGEDLLAKLQAHLQQGQGEEEAEEGGEESRACGVTLVETAGGVQPRAIIRSPDTGRFVPATASAGAVGRGREVGGHLHNARSL